MTVNLATKELNKIIVLARTIKLPLSEIIVVGPIGMSHTEMSVAIDWCHDATGESIWSYQTGRHMEGHGTLRYETEFYFVDPSVAMMFKLKFG